MYVMLVTPEDLPYTEPPDVTVATAVAELLHVPPAVRSLSVIVWPIQTEDRPRTEVIGLTVTVVLWKQPPIV
jgi:hypothetical protein